MKKINIDINHSSDKTPIKNMKELSRDMAEVSQKAEEAKVAVEAMNEQVSRNTTEIKNLSDSIVSPDEEDITSVDKVIKFADKDYIPEVYSGLGRVYLRKNLVSGELTEVLNEDGITFEDGVWGKQVSISTVFGTAAVKASLSVNGGEVNDGYVISLTKYKDGSTVKSVGVGIFGREITTDDKDAALRGWFNTSYIPFVTADDYDTIILRVEKSEGQMSESDIVSFSIKTKGIGSNILTQDMINKPNTIYHIQYDYDLNGAEITVPEGCTLEFEGGSFANGKVVFTDTIVNGSANTIFKNIQKNGNYKGDTDYLIEADLDNYYNKEDSDKRYTGIGEDRPVLTVEDAGRSFFDTTTGLVIWNGTKWVDTKGMTAGVHKGNTEYRGGMPIGTLTEADWYGALDSTPEFNGFKNGVAQTQGDAAGTGTPHAIYFDRIRGKFLFESEDPNIPGNYLYWEKWVGSTYTPFVNPKHGTIYKENDNYWKYIAPKTNATLKLDPATDIGYEYFDTDLGKMVYAKSIAADGTASWVDANGMSC